MLPPDWSTQPPRILVVRPGALGDVLLTLPALDALQSRFPQATIEVMGNPTVLRLLLGRSVVREISAFDRADLGVLFSSLVSSNVSVQGYLAQFDIVLSYATPPDHPFAQNLARLSPGWVRSSDPRPTQRLQVHMSEYLQQPLQALDVEVRREPPRLTLTEEDRHHATEWWQSHGLAGRQVTAIHPGSGSEAKNWPASRFASLAKQILRARQVPMLLVGGPADAAALGPIQRALGERDHMLLLDAPLHHLAAILARCQVYIGNDSGVSHLAAAVGVPTVAVFGPTDPVVWAPRGPRVRIVRGIAPCAPCDAEHRGRCTERDCLLCVSVGEVMQAWFELADAEKSLRSAR
jgi:ADP-heptose:LPS heptosyltransferase